MGPSRIMRRRRKSGGEEMKIRMVERLMKTRGRRLRSHYTSIKSTQHMTVGTLDTKNMDDLLVLPAIQRLEGLHRARRLLAEISSTSS